MVLYRTITRRISLLVILLVGISFQTAHAATYDVGCDPNPTTRVQTLIDAITTANSTSSDDTIRLDAGCVYTLTGVHNSTNDENGLPVIPDQMSAGALTIEGRGATITRDPDAPAFRFLLIAEGANVTIDHVTMTDGIVEGSIGDLTVYGGAILNSGTLTVTNSTFSDNSAIAGGAIFNDETLTVATSTFSHNVATGGGGALFNAGTPLVYDSVMTVEDSTFSGNSVGLTSLGLGGAIGNALSNLIVTRTTISGNTADYGGGIYSQAGTFKLAGSIVAGNTGSVGSPDVDGAIHSMRYNIIGDASSIIIGGETTGNLLDEDAQPLNLGGLADNGGPTQTIALLAGSIAINAGDPSFASPPDYDQRGTGYARVNGGRIDIGPFEAAPSSLQIQLDLQGREPAPNPGWAISGAYKVEPEGGGSVLVSGVFTSDQDGRFSLAQLTSGNYRIWIKGSHTLANAAEVTLAAGSNDLSNLPLLEGDADNSNSVILTDFSLLAASFGIAEGSPGYDERADFNQDDAVNLVDFSLLASNFNKAGAS